MKHLKSLDSLRGIACISVFFCHSTSEVTRYKTFNIIASGNEAVVIFFVLSGFVLTIAYDRSIKFNFLSYAVKRIFRIYPAYYCAIFLAIICGLMSRITSDNILAFYLNTALLITQTSIVNNLDAPSWSLAYEVIISIMVMPIIWKIKDYRKFLIVLTFILLIFSLYIGYFVHIPSKSGFPIADKIIGIPYYSAFFILGVVLYEYKDVFQSRSNNIFFCISLLMYLNFYISFRYGSLVLTALGSCGIIMTAVYNPLIKKFLNISFYCFMARFLFLFISCTLF